MVSVSTTGTIISGRSQRRWGPTKFERSRDKWGTRRPSFVLPWGNAHLTINPTRICMARLNAVTVSICGAGLQSRNTLCSVWKVANMRRIYCGVRSIRTDVRSIGTDVKQEQPARCTQIHAQDTRVLVYISTKPEPVTL